MLIVYLVGCLITYLGGRWMVVSLRDKEEEYAEQIRRGLPFSVILWPLLAIGVMGFAIGMILMGIHDILPDGLKKKGHIDP